MSIEISSIDVVSSKHKIKHPSMVVSHFIHAGLPFGTIKVPLSIINASRAYLERVLWDFRGIFPKKVVYVFEVGPEGIVLILKSSAPNLTDTKIR